MSQPVVSLSEGLSFAEALREAQSKKKGAFPVVDGQGATVATLETVGKVTVTCEGESSTGHYTGNKTIGGVVVTFSKCAAFGGQCHSEGAAEGTIDPYFRRRLATEREWQLTLVRWLREIIGNPIRPVSIDPAWLRSNNGFDRRLVLDPTTQNRAFEVQDDGQTYNRNEFGGSIGGPIVHEPQSPQRWFAEHVTNGAQPPPMMLLPSHGPTQPSS